VGVRTGDPTGAAIGVVDPEGGAPSAAVGEPGWTRTFGTGPSRTWVAGGGEDEEREEKEERGRDLHDVIVPHSLSHVYSV